MNEQIEEILRLKKDVRPVVLCRDCKHADFAGMGNGTVWCDKMERAMQEEDFCSYGKKMEES